MVPAHVVCKADDFERDNGPLKRAAEQVKQTTQQVSTRVKLSAAFGTGMAVDYLIGKLLRRHQNGE